MSSRMKVGGFPISVLIVGALCFAQAWAASGVKRLGPWQALITAEVEGEKHIQILDLKTGQAADPANGPLRGQDPRVAPTRDSFCFLYGESGPAGTTLSLSDLSGNFRTLYQCPEGQEIMACAWWPDGHGILLVVAARSRQGQATLITVTRSRQVSSPLTVPLSPECAGFPGNRTVFLNTGYGNQALLDLRTGQVSDFGLVDGMALCEPRLSRADGRLYTSAWQGYVPASQWSRYPNAATEDAKAFAATGIYSFKPDGTDLQRVPNLRGKRKPDGNRMDVRLLDISPDGKYLLYTYYNGYEGLWIADRNGKGVTKVPGMGQQLEEASWSG